MADGHDDSSTPRRGHDGDTDRQWRHPSEVGQAARGRVDRRRSTYVAAGVLLGGLGVLMTGVMMGHAAWSEPEPVASPPRWDRTEAAVAEVTFVTDGDTPRSTTGVVLDDAGHVVVDADDLERADEIWARCVDGQPELAEVVGSEGGLTVLRLGTPGGRPAVFANVMPTPETDVELVRSSSGTLRRDAVSVAPRHATLAAVSVTVRPGAAHFDVRLDGPVEPVMAEAAVFDHGGRLIGLASSDNGVGADDSSLTVMSAAMVMDVADRIIDRAAG